MAGHPGPRRLQTYILLISILLQQLIHAQTTSDNCFGDYGSCSQQVILPLFEATGCLCSSASCACSNQTYLFNVMADVGACCTFSELNNTAQTSIDNCINNGSPSVVSFEELLDAGKAGTTSSCPIAALATLKPSSMTSNRAQITTTTASGTRGNALTSSASEPNVATSPTESISSSTATATSTNTLTGLVSSSGLTKDEKIAIGIGVPTGTISLIGLCLTLWWYCFRKRPRPDPGPPLNHQSSSSADSEAHKGPGAVTVHQNNGHHNPVVGGSQNAIHQNRHSDRYIFVGHTPSVLDRVLGHHRSGANSDAGTHPDRTQSYHGQTGSEHRARQGEDFGIAEEVYELGHMSV